MLGWATRKAFETRPAASPIIVVGAGRQPADHNELRCWFASWPWDANMRKTMMDRAQLADFLRRRRDALRPGDVGLDIVDDAPRETL